jgi:hypothetical protein
VGKEQKHELLARLLEVQAALVLSSSSAINKVNDE